MTHAITKAGLKIYDGTKHVKTISSKYEEVYKRVPLDFKKIRPSQEEQKQLNQELFKLEVDKYHAYLKENEKYVFELIQGKQVVGAQRVVNLQGDVRLELIYENGVKIRCSRSLYELFSEKLETRHSNY